MFVQIELMLLFFTVVHTAPNTDQLTYKVDGILPIDLAIKPFETPAYCHLSMDYGHGDGSTQLDSWYFDHESDQCEQFNFLGSGGNLNRFESQIDCMTNCTGDPCRQVTISDTTFGALTVDGKYLECNYDAATKNDNCPNEYYCSAQVGVCCRQESFDVCSLPKAEGIRVNEHVESRRLFYYNRENGLCESFTFNGVGGNQNRFEKKIQCDLACARSICPDNHHPYSKMYGPIHCTDVSHSCPEDFGCVHFANSSISYCCPEVTKLIAEDQPQDDTEEFGFSAAARSVAFTSVTLMTLVFALQ